LRECIENSSIWHTLKQDQDCSILTSFDLARRTGQRNAIPEAPSDPQEISQVPPGYPTVAYTMLLLDKLKNKVVYITHYLFTLQVSQGSGPVPPNYKKSIRTFEKGDPQQWMDVITIA
jgi:hypothetical protein